MNEETHLKLKKAKFDKLKLINNLEDLSDEITILIKDLKDDMAEKDIKRENVSTLIDKIDTFRNNMDKI